MMSDKLVSVLLFIGYSLLSLIILEIGVSSLVIYGTTDYQTITNSSINLETINCYNSLRHFNFWYGIYSCVQFALFVFLGVLFYILDKKAKDDASLGILILTAVLGLFYFAIGAAFSGSVLFPNECKEIKTTYYIIWAISCTTFSLCAGIVGISLLSCLGSMCNGYMNADD